MAMTLRLPEELDRQLERVAAERHTSKQALLIDATERFLRDEGRLERILDAVEAIGDEYADVIKRLEDA